MGRHVVSAFVVSAFRQACRQCYALAYVIAYRAYRHLDTCIQTHACMQTCMLTYEHVDLHAFIRTCLHARTLTHAYTNVMMTAGIADSRGVNGYQGFNGYSAEYPGADDDVPRDY